MALFRVQQAPSLKCQELYSTVPEKAWFKKNKNKKRKKERKKYPKEQLK